MRVPRGTSKSRRRRRSHPVFDAIKLLFLSACAIGMVLIAVAIWQLSDILPRGSGAIGDLDPIESTKILSSEGYELATVFMEENREYVPLSRIPKHLRNATVATEDRRFYEHHGVDTYGIMRALVEDIRKGARAQGGSTITQQLVRNVFLTRRKSFSRKIQEAILAVQIERKYSKDEILEKYLNQVFYGSGAYGVQAASRVYFNKKVGDLTLNECALLAGLPQRPSAFSPYKNPDAARKRRDTVLARMAQQNYITPAERREAEQAGVKVAFKRASGARVRRAPYFVDYILDNVIDRYGATTVYKGGLRIYTTLHTAMQAAADKAVKDGVERLANLHVSQGALVSIDPRTGYIRAMVGGVDYKKSQLNRAYLARHPRSPGSAFKPFVYAAAFEEGMDPYDTVTDAPITIEDGHRDWSPKNYDDRWMGAMSIQRAIAQSRNIPAIQTIRKVGVSKVIEMAHRLGVDSPLGKNLSLAIGTSGVTMVEIAAAYGVFANNGVLAEPIAITKITDRDGGIIELNRPKVRRVLQPRINAMVDQCLRAVTSPGGTAVRIGYAIRDARGKTGTAQEDRDAWFVGYVPKELATAVWVGNDDNSRMWRVFGGANCGPIWTDYMGKALKLNPKMKSAPKPEDDTVTATRTPGERDEPRKRRRTRDRGESADTPRDGNRIEICADTGLRATSRCPSTYRVSFREGDAPTETCGIHSTGGDTRSRRRSDRVSEDGGGTDRNEGRRPVNTEESAAPSEAEDPADEAPAAPRDGDAPRVEAALLRRASEPESRVTVRRRDAEPERRRSDAADRPEPSVRVALCLQTGQRATRYCPDTIQRRLPASSVPSRSCSVHTGP